MNFQFNLNETFPGSHNSVIKIGQDLLPDDFNTFTSNSRNFHQIQQRVSDILDKMGQASARAQDLKAPITSGSKLRMHKVNIQFIYFWIGHLIPDLAP